MSNETGTAELYGQPDEDELNRLLDAEIAEEDAPNGLRLLTVSDLADLPEPKYLVQDFIRKAGFNVLSGPSGIGKSVLTQDWSLCHTTGRPFYGQEVERGCVVYIAAEGASGLYQRIEGWRLARGVAAEEIRDFYVVPEAINFYRGDTDALVAALDQLSRPPSLIVVDTMARSMVGGDENSARDVGLFIANLDQVRGRYGAAALVVHHTGKDGNLERGSSALRGAADTLVALKPDGGELKLNCEKQKDGAEFSPWHFALVESGDSVRIDLRTIREELTPSERQILETVRRDFRTVWFTQAEAVERTGLGKGTVSEAVNALVGRGLEERPRNGRQREYRLTEGAESDRSAPFGTVQPNSAETVRSSPGVYSPRTNGTGGSETSSSALISQSHQSLEDALIDPNAAEALRASVAGEWITVGEAA